MMNFFVIDSPTVIRYDSAALRGRNLLIFERSAIWQIAIGKSRAIGLAVLRRALG
jgi:hypothetical protein